MKIIDNPTLLRIFKVQTTVICNTTQEWILKLQITVVCQNYHSGMLFTNHSCLLVLPLRNDVYRYVQIPMWWRYVAFRFRTLQQFSHFYESCYHSEWTVHCYKVLESMIASTVYTCNLGISDHLLNRCGLGVCKHHFSFSVASNISLMQMKNGITTVPFLL